MAFRFIPLHVPEVPGTVEIGIDAESIVFYGGTPDSSGALLLAPLRTLHLSEIAELGPVDLTGLRIVGGRDIFAKPDPEFYLHGPLLDDSGNRLLAYAIRIVIGSDDEETWEGFQGALREAGYRTRDLG